VKEKECSDSDGNRLRSSMEFKAGEDGTVFVAVCGGSRDMMGDAADRETALEEGDIIKLSPSRNDGCCRIRRRPERPEPCSPPCSGIIGDLACQ
jgi:hypothetical protein